MDVKDYFYNLTKTVSYVLGYIMDNKTLKDQLFTIFFSFVNNEYSVMMLKKKTNLH